MANSDVRYGAEIRSREYKVRAQKNTSYPCPKCGKEKVRRKSNSIWKCRSCSAVFAGGAYSFSTPTGVVAKRAVGEYGRR